MQYDSENLKIKEGEEAVVGLEEAISRKYGERTMYFKGQ
jgi:hypothetical protein